MYKSENINELSKALSLVQSEIKDAKLDKKNPFFDSRYASLESIYAATRTTLAKHSLSFSQIVEPYNDQISISTILMHSSGQWIKSSMPVKVDMGKPQAIGSAISYGKRYTLAAIVGISDTEDDDANEAEKSNEVDKVAAKNKEPAPIAMLSKNQINALKEALGNDTSWMILDLKNKGYDGWDAVEASKYSGLMADIIKRKATQNATS